jgi:SAM-dependent methyltransferase
MASATSNVVAALRRLVLDLEADLRARVDGDDPYSRQDGVFDAWTRDYDKAAAANRTAAAWPAWRNDRVTQAAVAWVLLTVFARYCEDNALVTPRWISGADADERAHALDARRAYFQAHPEDTDREWLTQISGHFTKFPATAGLVDRFSPMHLVAPSGDAARKLLEFWWQQDGDGAPMFSFAGMDTRFLGNIYQDLSEHAKKTYALLQTPEFVEEFILDQTMEPALADRALEGFTVIDPTCGSGHFLLGAFHRLHERWQRHAPALGPRELVEKALDGIYGVDINPFAVAIARFRLLVAGLQAAGDTSLEQSIAYTPHLAAGDSLLWGANQQLLPDDLLASGPSVRADTTEDADALTEILQREHDVVVGNPPYITVKDAALKATYRKLYTAIHRQVTLTVPFMELFFKLGHGSGHDRPAGWVGQITSNSFMKRPYVGPKLINTFFPTVDLQKVIDSEGAWIPGHNMDGTPTVILFGRSRRPVSPIVRAVLSKGVREAPAETVDGQRGPYWTSIVEHLSVSGHEDGYISVADLPRDRFHNFPWVLSGGGANDLLEELDTKAVTNLRRKAKRIGYFGDSHADEIFFLPEPLGRRIGAPSAYLKMSSRGEDVRDWIAQSHQYAILPYTFREGRQIAQLEELGDALQRYLWRFRQLLGSRGTFGGGTYFSDDRPWYEWHQFPTDDGCSEQSIAFADLASHNHFVLDPGGRVFNRTAPLIKLGDSASADDHFQLLGVLNSSVACFWLRQNSQPKGGAAEHAWSRTHQYTATALKRFPLPASTPVELPRLIENYANDLNCQSPATLAQRETPSAAALDAARTEWNRLSSLMIAHQEELDWDYYRIYGLIDDDLTYAGEVPPIRSAERAFAIVLAREVEDGEQAGWFEHPEHRFTPITDIPTHLPADYRELMQRRLDAIATNQKIQLLERPEYKRRWASDLWEKQLDAALRAWLLDRLDDKALWFDRDGRPTPQSVAQLADILDRNGDFCTVLHLWAGSTTATTGTALAKLLDSEAVPFLAAYRYKESGLDKRSDWEATWALQRRADAGEKLPSGIPTPRTYTSADFASTAYWSYRGELDVPKERFISYPGAGRDSDTTELLGWAGWDHADQALALAGLISQRIEDGWDTPKLIPMLAGLDELLPWVQQWHNEIDPEYGESVADTIADELTTRLAENHLTVTELTAWRPEPTRKPRTRKTS